MTTLGTHPFIPAASRLGAPILCQKCRHDAVDPVHDWLSTPVQSPGGDIEPYSTQPGGVNECPHGWSMRSFCQECRLEDARIQAEAEQHTKDSDCTINPETLCCDVCGVEHGDECAECGGRGFHKPTCACVPLTDAEYAEAYPDGNPRQDLWETPLSPMTPEEMVMLPNLFTAEEWAERDAQQPDSSQQPVEDIDGYCVRLNQQVRDIQRGGR